MNKTPVNESNLIKDTDKVDIFAVDFLDDEKTRKPKGKKIKKMRCNFDREDFNKMKDMEDSVFLELCKKLHALTQNYSSGAIKHHQYAPEYDRLLECYNVSKKEFIELFENYKKRMARGETNQLITLPSKPLSKLAY